MKGVFLLIPFYFFIFSCGQSKSSKIEVETENEKYEERELVNYFNKVVNTY